MRIEYGCYFAKVKDKRLYATPRKYCAKFYLGEIYLWFEGLTIRHIEILRELKENPALAILHLKEDYPIKNICQLLMNNVGNTIESINEVDTLC